MFSFLNIFNILHFAKGNNEKTCISAYFMKKFKQNALIKDAALFYAANPVLYSTENTQHFFQFKHTICTSVELIHNIKWVVHH